MSCRYNLLYLKKKPNAYGSACPDPQIASNFFTLILMCTSSWIFRFKTARMAAACSPAWYMCIVTSIWMSASYCLLSQYEVFHFLCLPTMQLQTIVHGMQDGSCRETRCHDQCRWLCAVIINVTIIRGVFFNLWSPLYMWTVFHNCNTRTKACACMI